ncbi:hypothetical protein ACQKKG_00485 [Brevundimonas sp. NPDC003935]|uniref:hypothetical protein n=1 Tax=unclassified Brevundimonas TaxID=2622653 RepID=UPI00289D1EEC|nr:hypothetical protein [Brevundimonas sp.]
MSLFDHVEALQGNLPWGRFLDAGTGVNSSLWSTALTTDAWTGVTAAAVGDRGLVESLALTIQRVRHEGLALCAERNGLGCGADYVVACEPI